MEKTEVAGSILERLFAVQPTANNKYVHAKIRELYTLCLLKWHWQEICGEKLATNCCVQKVEKQGTVLVVVTKSSAWSNNLFMMKKLFIQKINSVLTDRTLIEDIKFVVGNCNEVLPKDKEKLIQTESIIQEKDARCPRCGAIILLAGNLCSICTRQEKAALKEKIAELLRIQPWLDYQGMLAYYQCGRILFTAVKDNLSSIYFEKVRKGTATTADELLAVLFLTGKKPDEIDEQNFRNALEYLRRDYLHVSASGNGLHGQNK